MPTDELRSNAQASVLTTWAKADPAASTARTRELIPTLTAGVTGNGMITELTLAYAAQDPSAALRFASELPPEFRANPAIAAARAWAQTDAVAALDWCLANGIDVTRGLRMGVGGRTGAVLKEAMLNHPEATVAWVEAMPAGAERDRLMERALRERLDNTLPMNLFTDQNEYVLRLFDQLPSDAQQRAAAGIGSALASRADFNDLTEVLNQFQDDATRQRVIVGAFTQLGNRNGAKAEAIYSAFAANLPPGPQLDAVTSAYARGYEDAGQRSHPRNDH